MSESHNLPWTPREFSRKTGPVNRGKPNVKKIAGSWVSKVKIQDSSLQVLQAPKICTDKNLDLLKMLEKSKNILSNGELMRIYHSRK